MLQKKKKKLRAGESNPPKNQLALIKYTFEIIKNKNLYIF